MDSMVWEAPRATLPNSMRSRTVCFSPGGSARSRSTQHGRTSVPAPVGPSHRQYSTVPGFDRWGLADDRGILLSVPPNQHAGVLGIHGRIPNRPQMLDLVQIPLFENMHCTVAESSDWRWAARPLMPDRWGHQTQPPISCDAQCQDWRNRPILDSRFTYIILYHGSRLLRADLSQDPTTHPPLFFTRDGLESTRHLNTTAIWHHGEVRSAFSSTCVSS